MNLVLYPEPPHISAGFYFDATDQVTAFNAVCQHLITSMAAPSGYMEVVRSAKFPRFTMISDLADQLELLKFNSGESKTLEQTTHWPPIEDTEIHILRAGFKTPQAGLAVVEFGLIPQGLGMDVPHPIAVTTSCALLSTPASNDKHELAQAKKTSRFVMEVFRSVCEELDPLYGSVVVEASLPVPAELTSAKNSRIGTELFISFRLAETDPLLEPDLIGIFDGGFFEHWRTGIFFSGWNALNPMGRAVDAPLEVGARAARRLGLALKVKGR